MSEPFIGEIRMFGGNFAPVGWAFCDGSLVAISQNDALFTLIGTTYGGDGQNTFGLPDLRGRVPLHRGSLAGNTYTLGQTGGIETVQLTVNQIPAHTHEYRASTANATTGVPSQATVPATSAQVKIYSLFPAAAAMNPQSILPAGGSQSHENMMPFQVVTFIISLFGIFPQRN